MTTGYEWNDEQNVPNGGNFDERRRDLSSGETLSVVSRMAGMLGSGLSVVDALDCFAEETADGGGTSRLASDAVLWRNEVMKGKPLSKALDSGFHRFPEAFSSVVKAGESTGKLSETMAVYAAELRRMEAAERKMRSAVVYPSVVVAVALLLVVMLCTVALPKLEQMFTSVGVPPKGISATVFAFGRFVASWGAIPPLIIVLVFDFWLFSPRGRRSFIRFLGFIPEMRKIRKASEWCVFCSSTGISLHAGLGLINALESNKTAAPASLSGAVYSILLNGIASGKSILSVDGTTFPAAFKGFVRAGEKNGSLAEAFVKAGEHFSAELEERLSSFSRTVEPAITLCVLAVVGIIPVAIVKTISDMYVAVMSKAVQ